MAESYVAQNMAHKRTYDDIGPEDGPGPSGSRRESLGSSSAASGSRERNKRARNDTADSAYASEVDDLLISSNTSDVSSSTSSGSHSSYHSARSTFTAASPALLPVDEHADGEQPLPEVLSSLSPETSIDASMDDDLPFPRPTSIAPAPAIAPSQPERPDSADQLRRTLERFGAFDREIAALRQSPPGTQSPVWQPWSAQMPTSSDGPCHLLIPAV
ncbi:hypothetical protein C8Q74DRAFT_376286 [Fomes fomentarius]|nr:hypothetical protein C8Q74DRAFT_376286 [Fomes fomentarius]